MFALVDCNNFYASCERVFRPDLNGKPVVVLSNNDGCVIARSNEAKAAGIPMGAPAFEYEKLFEQHSVQVFSANFALYGDMSSRVMDILSGYSPDMEIYSIDEAFLKFTGFEHFDLQQHGASMRSKVLKWTGIPISVGIAPTKALAKVANRIAKKYPTETRGVYIIDSEEKRIKALKWLKTEDVWGIGRQHSQRLYRMDVATAYAFTQLRDDVVQKMMSITGLRLKHDLEGIPTLDMEEAQIKKNIATTRTFETNYTQYGQLAERISTFASACAEKLRLQNSCCHSLMVFIHTNRHREDLPQYSRNIVIKLPYPTNSGIELTKFALQALKQIFKQGFAYKRAGVVVQDFSQADRLQRSLFENRDERHVPLFKVVDAINTHFGQQKVRLAAQDTKRVWKMRQEKLSPRYTTRIDDIITIHV
ncbi:MAG TPA: Y-family DNA polymerase [Saprospiraceae bacterium]|nr:Y-family DNA polymerase [Saprospiraceae bacterium]HRO07475.1 Y-family DNA polymerase [Saprospiraceae bacterium]HRP40758.1 Y-family DNA polymerase [Saprospiraceae bacterium]